MRSATKTESFLWDWRFGSLCFRESRFSRGLYRAYPFELSSSPRCLDMTPSWETWPCTAHTSFSNLLLRTEETFPQRMIKNTYVQPKSFAAKTLSAWLASL